MATNRPKRKRAEISYLESDLDDFDGHGQIVDLDEDEEEPEFEDKLRKKSKVNAKQQAKIDAGKTKKKQKKKKESIFPFFSLSAELRNQIYGHLLVEPDGLDLIPGVKDEGIVRGKFYRAQHTLFYRYRPSSHKAYGKKRVKMNRLQLAVLRVCRQMHEEALPVLYGQEITLHGPLALFNFLSEISLSNSFLLKNLVVYGWEWPEEKYRRIRRPVMVLLRSATNLTRLFFAIEEKEKSKNGYRDVGVAAGSISKDLKYWSQPFDVAKGRKGAALEVFGLDKHFFEHSYSKTNDIDLDKLDVDFKAKLKKMMGTD